MQVIKDGMVIGQLTITKDVVTIKTKDKLLTTLVNRETIPYISGKLVDSVFITTESDEPATNLQALHDYLINYGYVL